MMSFLGIVMVFDIRFIWSTWICNDHRHLRVSLVLGVQLLVQRMRELSVRVGTTSILGYELPDTPDATVSAQVAPSRSFYKHRKRVSLLPFCCLWWCSWPWIRLILLSFPSSDTDLSCLPFDLFISFFFFVLVVLNGVLFGPFGGEVSKVQTFL